MTTCTVLCYRCPDLNSDARLSQKYRFFFLSCSFIFILSWTMHIVWKSHFRTFLRYGRWLRCWTFLMKDFFLSPWLLVCLFFTKIPTQCCQCFVFKREIPCTIRFVTNNNVSGSPMICTLEHFIYNAFVRYRIPYTAYHNSSFIFSETPFAPQKIWKLQKCSNYR